MGLWMFFIRVVVQGYMMALKETLNLLYLALTNFTFAGGVLYITRTLVGFSLWTTDTLIQKTEVKNNPIVKVLEKDLDNVPKSKLMTSSEHETANGVIGESVEEMKVVSMSFLVV